MNEISQISQELTTTYKYRDEQIKQLLAAVSDGYQSPWHCVYVYGHAATGKSMIIDALMKKLKLTYIKVNLIECYSSQVLYELILQQLDDNCQGACNNMSDFVKNMKAILSEKYSISSEEEYGNNKTKTICLVLERAERLRDMEKHILPSILRLRELVGHQLCVILVSDITWSKLMTGHQFTQPVRIHFAEYTRQQIESILLAELVSAGMKYGERLYEAYISLFTRMVYPACQNLRELSFLAHENFDEFCAPVNNNELTERDIPALWKRNQDHLSKVVNTVYLRESNYNWQQPHANTDKGSSYVEVELPFYTKYLVIAAYLASYNPARYDKQLFVKHSERSRKHQKRVKIKHDKDNCHLNGPKTFDLNRLLAIFGAITENKVAPTVYIESQISTLVKLRLLERCSAESDLSSLKYKCLAELGFVEKVSSQVHFELHMYLYDFN